MGEVYRAHDPRLQRDVALKILPSRDPLARQRFEREALAIAALNHPNIVTIFSVEEAEGIPFLTMELVDGQSLGKVIPANGLPLEKLLPLAIPVAEALWAAHQKGIIHRDLKPANIMVTRDGRVKVLDFGLAKTLLSDVAAAEMPTVAATGSGGTLGTVKYMSPEQARGDALDVRSDIFTLGVVLFEMATGHRPFDGLTDAVVFDAILNKPAPQITRYAPDVPIELDRLIMRALQKKVVDRYSSVADLLMDLTAIGTAATTVTAVGRRAPTDARPAGPSIAVLPFANLSADPEQEYFCEGMAEELIGTLAKIRGLAVAARTSSFQLKGQGLDLQQIGERLNVQAVVEGSVRRIGNRLRITAQVINVSDGYHLWAEKFDRQADDVFAIQDEIAKAIADALEVTLTTSTSRPLVKRATENLEAYNLYLRGRYLMNQLTADIQSSFMQAIASFDQAVALDPSFAGAWAGLSECYSTLGYYTFMPSAEAGPKAVDCAKRAVMYDATLAEGHSALGWAKTNYHIELATAERDFRRALELAPSYAQAHGYLATLLSALGRFDEALASVNEALRLDPLWLVNRYVRCQVLIGGRKFDLAEQEMRGLMELNASLPGTFWYLGYALGGQGRFDEAAVEIERGIAVVGGVPLYVCQAALMHAFAGRREPAEKAIAELGAFTSAYQMALLHRALGDRERAFQCLEKAVADHNEVVFLMGVDWRYDALRNDPKFPVLLRAMGLPA